MSKSEDMPIDERIKELEYNLTNTKKQIEILTEQLMGTIVILCLPMKSGKKLEFGFKAIEKLPNHILQLIIKRYVQESKNTDLNFDEMIDPLFVTFGFERLWKLLDAETIREYYGEWALNKWEEMGRTHKCEG